MNPDSHRCFHNRDQAGSTQVPESDTDRIEALQGTSEYETSSESTDFREISQKVLECASKSRKEGITPSKEISNKAYF